MKVIAINSSPRGHGTSKTRLLLDALVKGMREANAEVETSSHGSNAQPNRMSGTDCGSCQRGGKAKIRDGNELVCILDGKRSLWR